MLNCKAHRTVRQLHNLLARAQGRNELDLLRMVAEAAFTPT